VKSCGRVIGDNTDVFLKEKISFLRRVRPNILAIHEGAAAAGDFLAQAAMSLVRTPDAPQMQPLDIPPTTPL
jgi:hypothetical protein